MTHPIQLLIIASDTQERQPLQAALRQSGIPLKAHFTDPDMALDTLRHGRYDAVWLTLYHNPGAFALIRAIREDGITADLPVFLMSTLIHPTELEQAYHAGATAHLPRPSVSGEYDTLVETFARFWRHLAPAPRGAGKTA
ncbi:MAG: hypothetical protein AAFV53_35340 [Myxococcota bacterium]